MGDAGLLGMCGCVAKIEQLPGSCTTWIVQEAITMISLCGSREPVVIRAVTWNATWLQELLCHGRR